MCVTTMMSPTAASTTASNTAPSKDKSQVAPFCYSMALTEVILLHHMRYLYLRPKMASYIRRHGSDVYLGMSLVQNGGSYLMY